MNSRPSLPHLAFWGICLIAVAWIVLTVLFELHLGWPTNMTQLTKRIVGWVVEVWFIRTLIVRAGRINASTLR
jgi:hypothetical protein